MTKTTNFEISKKLAEIGFKAKWENCWEKNNEKKGIYTLFFFEEWNRDLNNYYPSYDLETILEALPCGLDQGNEQYNLKMLPNISISYTNKFFNHIYDYRDDFCCENGEVMYCIRKNKETMVDMAGRLLIKLYENNLIKFKE